LPRLNYATKKTDLDLALEEQRNIIYNTMRHYIILGKATKSGFFNRSNNYTSYENVLITPYIEFCLWYSVLLSDV